MTGIKVCPYCAEEIKAAAIVCKHCGRELPGFREAVANAPDLSQESDGADDAISISRGKNGDTVAQPSSVWPKARKVGLVIALLTIPAEIYGNYIPTINGFSPDLGYRLIAGPILNFLFSTIIAAGVIWIWRSISQNGKRPRRSTIVSADSSTSSDPISRRPREAVHKDGLGGIILAIVIGLVLIALIVWLAERGVNSLPTEDPTPTLLPSTTTPIPRATRNQSFILTSAAVMTGGITQGCLRYDQLDLAHFGQALCIYGVVEKILSGPFIDANGNVRSRWEAYFTANSDFLRIQADIFVYDITEGQCVRVDGTVRLWDDHRIYFNADEGSDTKIYLLPSNNCD